MVRARVGDLDGRLASSRHALGGRAARLLAQGLPKTHRVVVVDKHRQASLCTPDGTELTVFAATSTVGASTCKMDAR